MNKINSFASTAANAIKEAEDVGKADGASTSEAEEASEIKKTEGPGDSDRWESFKDMGQSALGGVSNKIENARAGKEVIRDAIVGAGQSKATEGLAKAAEWIRPTVETVESIKEMRTGIQDRVRETIEGVDRQMLQEVADDTARNFGDFVKTIHEAVQDPSRTKTAVVAEYQSTKNGIKNAVIETVCNALVKYEDQVELTGQGLQKLANLSPMSPLVDSPSRFIAPAPMRAFISATWALDEVGKAVEKSPAVAEQLLETPPLPTKENYDEWLEHIGPGESYHHEYGFGFSLTYGLGAKLGVNHEWVIERSETDPNRITLTLADKEGVMVTVGKEVQGQGKSAGIGGERAGAIQFEFDTNNPKELELLADITLCNQAGLSNGALIAAAADHMVSYTQELKGLAGIEVGAGPGTANITAEHGLLYQSEKRLSGQVDRLAFTAQRGLSAGNSIGRLPQGLVDEMADSASTADREILARLTGTVNAGQMGIKAGAAIDVNTGVEMEGAHLERIFLEAKFGQELLGFDGEVVMEFVVNDPVAIAAALGQSVSDLASAATSGEVDIEALYEAAVNSDLDLDDAIGFKVTRTITDVDGLEIDTPRFNYGSTIQRRDSQVIHEFGTPIDRSREERDTGSFKAGDYQMQDPEHLIRG